jgi:hypothetical protein
MADRMKVTDNRGRTVGYIKPEDDSDEAFAALATVIALVAGVAIFYAAFQIIAKVWRSGRLGKLVIIASAAAIGLLVLASAKPAFAEYAANQADRYVSWASRMPITSYPNTNLTLVSLGIAAAAALAIWVLWRPMAVALQLLVTTLMVALVISYAWAFWFAVGQVVGLAVRIAANWLTSGDVGSGLDWLQTSVVCFLLALPLGLHKDGWYLLKDGRHGHFAKRTALVESALLVGLVCLTPAIGAALVGSLGLMPLVDLLAAQLGVLVEEFMADAAMDFHFLSQLPPVLPPEAIMLGLMTLIGAPVAGVVVTAYLMFKNAAGKLMAASSSA